MLLRLLGEISLSLLCLHSSRGSALDLVLPLRVGHLRPSVLRSDRMGLKKPLILGLWLTQAGGEGRIRMRGKPAVAEAIVTLHQPEAQRRFSQGSCLWITDPGSDGLHRLPGGSVDSE